MAVDLFANAANTTLSAAIGTAGATSFTVTSGVKFPTVSVAAGTQFRVIIDSELFIVTDSTTATWTVTPAAEGTTAATHLVNAPVTAIATAGALGKLGAALPSTGPAASGYYIPLTQPGQSGMGSNSVFVNVVGRGGVIPFTVSRSFTPTSFSVQVTTAAAASFLRLGFYADNGVGKPGVLITDYGQVDASTTGVKTWTNTTALVAGTVYYFLVVAQGASSGTVQVTTHVAVGSDVGDTSPANALGGVHEGYDLQGVTGVMPANASAVTQGAVNYQVRVVALVP